jgi:hypothetical protein
MMALMKDKAVEEEAEKSGEPKLVLQRIHWKVALVQEVLDNDDQD